MRKVLFILFFFVSTGIFSQTNQTDAHGLRQGRWEKKYPNGRLMYEGSFLDGQPVGQWIRYHSNGRVKARIRYDEDSDSVFVRLFNPRGKKVAEGAYVDEKRAGTWTFFSGNEKISEEPYQNGLKNGVARKFYSSGEVFEVAEWKDGKQEGRYEVFFKDGAPYMQCKYHNGKRDGLCLTYFRNGRIEMEAFYKDNLRDGKWKFYNPAGDSLYSLIYRNGKLLNPGVRDSVANLEILNLEKGRQSIADPEKFMQNPGEYMNRMQKYR